MTHVSTCEQKKETMPASDKFTWLLPLQCCRLDVANKTETLDAERAGNRSWLDAGTHVRAVNLNLTAITIHVLSSSISLYATFS